MSGFLSSEAEAALMGEGEQARRLFYQNQAQHSNRIPYGQQWTSNFEMNSSQPSVPSQPFTAPSQYVSWPSSAWPTLHPAAVSRGQSVSISTPIVPSSRRTSEQHYSNAPWPALHPDDVETPSDISRSVSPNPADLHNFGILDPDGRSWRCAYPQCTSQAVFTRGCDLRKHYRRHNKTLFCRREDCPQSREGGFSSKKDRDRHENRHAPQIQCSHRGCDRVFSRVDNMKDHVRRIHRKSP